MGAPLWGHGRAVGRPGAPLMSTPKGTTMQFISEHRLDDGVLERDFILGEIPGVLWTSGSAPAPLILSGHNGGLHKRNPRLVARARHHAGGDGFAGAALDAPGPGDRPPAAGH